MTAKKTDVTESAAERDLKAFDNFIIDYVKTYHDSISERDMDPLHLPQFYKGYPYAAEAYLLPNGALCVTLKKASRFKTTLIDGSNEEVLKRVRNQDFDFLQIFPPYTSFTSDEAARLAKLDADRDVKASKRLELLTAAEKQISSIHKDIQTVVDLNPWLDQQTMEQKAKLDNARNLIAELYSEVDVSREERFSDYSRQLAEVMAYEMGAMEEVAGEMELEFEQGLEELGERISALEAGLGSHKHESDSLNAVKSTIAELSKGLKEANIKIKAAEKASSSEDMDERLSEVEDSMKGIDKQIAALVKDFSVVKSDVALSQEIKDTVFRDSKRTYNLNERVTELERQFSSVGKDQGKVQKSEIKALEGKMNIMENELKKYVKNFVLTELENSQPVQKVSVEQISPLIQTENIPSGATVKKTTRTTTRKKRVK